jgi:predicted dehydrogenase
MAKSYAQALRHALQWPFVVAGRSVEKGQFFSDEVGALKGTSISDFYQAAPEYSFAIVATSIESMDGLTRQLINRGVKKILIEKPVALSSAQCGRLDAFCRSKKAYVRVATNRRFYSSVLQLAGILKKQKPVYGTFEFTEWAWQIEGGTNTAREKNRWAIANSIHVFDTVQALLGPFKILKKLQSGKNELKWHSSASTFLGLCKFGATPVSYATSWSTPGRWDIQVMTKEGRYRLSPMEKLQVQKPRTVQYEEVPSSDSWDTSYKPGLVRMLRSFDAPSIKEHVSLPTLSDMHGLLKNIESIVGYSR